MGLLVCLCFGGYPFRFGVFETSYFFNVLREECFIKHYFIDVSLWLKCYYSVGECRYMELRRLRANRTEFFLDMGGDLGLDLGLAPPPPIADSPAM